MPTGSAPPRPNEPRRWDLLKVRRKVTRRFGGVLDAPSQRLPVY
jgi:hypothetical protein